MNVTLKGVKLEAVSASLPEKSLTLQMLGERFGEKEVARIAMSTGIKTLMTAPPGLRSSDLCIHAAEQLFNQGGYNREDIDGLIFVSQTPDYLMPATSCIMQQRLGLNNNVVAFDINYGCSGYIYGLFQASLLISSGSCQNVLVCAGDTMTQHLAEDDHKLRMVLGDAGSATLVTKGDDSWSFDIHTDGAGFDKLIVPRTEHNQHGHLVMDGAAVMEFAIEVVHKTVNQVLLQKGWQKEDVGHFILHQPNKFMLQYLTKKLRVPAEKVPIAVEDYGNTGPVSIPLTLCHHFSHESEKPHRVIFSGFGVGLSWGAIGLDLSGCHFFAPTTYLA